MDKKTFSYRDSYSQTFEPWEKTPQMGIEPVSYRNGIFYITGHTWTEQKIKYQTPDHH